jgi:hypothetical protein
MPFLNVGESAIVINPLKASSPDSLPCLTKSRIFSSETPICFARWSQSGMPRSAIWLISRECAVAIDFSFTATLMNVFIVSVSPPPTDAMSPSRCRTGMTSSAATLATRSCRAPVTIPFRSNGVSSANFLNSSNAAPPASTEPYRLSREIRNCSKSELAVIIWPANAFTSCVSVESAMLTRAVPIPAKAVPRALAAAVPDDCMPREIVVRAMPISRARVSWLVRIWTYASAKREATDHPFPRGMCCRPIKSA